MSILIIIEGPDQLARNAVACALTKQIATKRALVLSPGLPTSASQFSDRSSRESHLELNNAMSPAACYAVNISASIDFLDRVIRPALKEGQIVVVDRYWWSDYLSAKAHGIAPALLDALRSAAQVAWDSIKPSVLFLFRPADNQSTELSDVAFQEYEILARQHSTIKVNLVPPSKTHRAAAKFCANALTNLVGENRKHKGNSIIRRSLQPAVNTVVYDTYWRFAAERQRIFMRRANGAPPPWTDDPILNEYKFTNAYRASDRVSQYLIRHVIYEGDQEPAELLFRILLFKIFNRIDTWTLLQESLGELSYATYSYQKYDKVLSRAMAAGVSIYSAAYIMPSGKGVFDTSRKHQMHLKLIDRMLNDELHKKLAATRTMLEGFTLLRAYPTLGDFLAFQYITDINYSTLTNYSESEFVVPGPGAFSGIHKCFSALGGLSEVDIIKLVTESQEREFARLNLDFETLWGRPLQFIDCQNLFCEVDKYSRLFHPEIRGISKRTRIKQRYRRNNEIIEYWFPPKWNINSRIGTTRQPVSTRMLF